MKSLTHISLSLAIITVVLCLLGALSSGLGVRINLWGFGVGINVLKWSAYLVGVPAVLCLISIVVGYLKKSGSINARHIAVLVLCAVIFGVPYQARTEFRKFPTVADATTDMVDSPTFITLADQRAISSKNPLEYRGGEAADLQREYFSSIKSIESSLTPEQVISTLSNKAKELGWTIASAENGRLEATETTFWFRFKDDVVVRTKEMVNGNTKVDIRSASRIGYLDGGANAKRVVTLMNELK